MKAMTRCADPRSRQGHLAIAVHVPFLRMRNTMLVRLSLRKASGCSDKKAHAKFCGSMQDAAYTDGGCDALVLSRQPLLLIGHCTFKSIRYSVSKK